MGACRIDRKAKQVEWINVTTTEVDSIKGLLKYRQKFDIFSNIHKSINIDASDVEILNEEIFSTYIDLDRIIEKCNFNQKQNEVLSMYMEGYTEEDISEKLNDNQQNINGIINSICKKIAKETNDNWYLNNITWNYIVPENGFKQCSKCCEILPAEKRFFGKDDRNLDGFQSFCKKCDANRKKI